MLTWDSAPYGLLDLSEEYGCSVNPNKDFIAFDGGANGLVGTFDVPVLGNGALRVERRLLLAHHNSLKSVAKEVRRRREEAEVSTYTTTCRSVSLDFELFCKPYGAQALMHPTSTYLGSKQPKKLVLIGLIPKFLWPFMQNKLIVYFLRNHTWPFCILTSYKLS